MTGNCDKNLQWVPLIWFKGCIRKHSICAWMFLRGKLKTKDFLLQRNVDCNSCCVLCDCTWESGSHLMLQCSYSQTVWSLLLAKLNLSSFVCNSPIELLESILLRIDQRHKGIQTVGKLICVLLFGIYGMKEISVSLELRPHQLLVCYTRLFRLSKVGWCSLVFCTRILSHVIGIFLQLLAFVVSSFLLSSLGGDCALSLFVEFLLAFFGGTWTSQLKEQYGQVWTIIQIYYS